MKVTLDRSRKLVWIEDVLANWASRVGFYFGHNYPDLGLWTIEAEAPPGSGRDVEHYVVSDLKGGACAIARFINNPPEPPNHCDTCRCPPECCK